MSDETTTVSDLADLKDIAAGVPQGDAAEIARVAAPLRDREVDAQGRSYATGCLLYTSPSPRDRG